MKHLGTVRLETERLILRKATLDDVVPAYKNWVTDDEVTKFLRWKSHNNIDETKYIFSSWINGYNNEVYNWIIELKEINEPIGTIGAIEIDNRIEMVHIGYALGRAWWGNGIMTEALTKLIEFFFEEVEVNRIESMFDPNNAGSGRVMKKSGMKHEGTLKQADWSNKGIVDASYYGLISEDYFEGK